MKKIPKILLIACSIIMTFIVTSATYNKYDTDKIEVTNSNYCALESTTTSTPTDESCFNFDSSTQTITGYNGITDLYPSDVIIPSTINGVEVKTIGDRAFFYKQLTSVILSDGITSIGDIAFAENKLINVTLNFLRNSKSYTKIVKTTY